MWCMVQLYCNQIRFLTTQRSLLTPLTTTQLATQNFLLFELQTFNYEFRNILNIEDSWSCFQCSTKIK